MECCHGDQLQKVLGHSHSEYITKVLLRAEVGISAGTMSKHDKRENVALSALLRICNYWTCDIGDIYECVRMKNDLVQVFNYENIVY